MKYIIAFLICLTLIHSATLFGNIYDADSLILLNNTIIKIDGSFSNQFIANGQYSIELPEGKYTITATHYNKGKIDYITKENVLVNLSQTKFDLILLPYDLYILTPSSDSKIANVSDPKSFVQGSNDQSIISSPIIALLLGVVILVIIIITGVAIFFIFRSKKNTSTNKLDSNKINPKIETSSETYLPDQDGKKIIQILQSNEGHMYQRELRQILNWSEAKMSVAITELEVSGIVKRFKKGRDNILKLLKEK